VQAGGDDTAMFETIVVALLPAVNTIGLAARHHDCEVQEVPILIRMMTYALPIALFVSTASPTRADLLQDLPLLIVLSVAILGVFGVVFLVCRIAFRVSLGTSASAALAASRARS
jgi:predicted permease